MRYNLKSTLKELLEKSFEKYADSTALIFNDTHLTYHEINTRANKLAHLLIELGIKAEDLVPICLDTGIDMIVGLLGILKSGGAYVPIEPDFPKDRTNYILSDCHAKVIVTTRQHKRNLSGTIPIISIDDSTALDKQPEHNPVIALNRLNLAYVIYTSGTTGIPNGVMLEHHSVVNNLLWSQKYLNTSNHDIVLQKTPFVFDVSVWEIFCPLISGAKLVILNKGENKDIQALRNIISRHNVNVIHFVPSMIDLFLSALEPGECGHLRQVICSGEALTPYQANLLRAKLPDADIHNLYGPTEAAIHATYWQVPDYISEIKKVLIGKPIDNTEIFILDEKRQQQDNGKIGEIYIGGVGVARGYLNRAELTAERFIENADDAYNNMRLFKTGDFGRVLNDGNIEYLGRIDGQVKVNGYRIELGAVEVNIKNSGVVNHAVILTKKNNRGFMQIVAYVTLKDGYSVQDVWDYLVTKLPGYMLPTIIKKVDHIPFTFNGKVDTDELLMGSLSENDPNHPVAPRTPLETHVYNIWRALFEKDNISIYDNFFDLGGNFIMAVKMLSTLKKETNKHVSFLLLNQFPTIESLAKLLAKPNILEIPNILVAIKPGGNKTPVYLINGGGLVADGFFNLSDELDEDQPVYGFQSNGYDSNGNTFKTIEDIAAHYIKRLLSENPHGPYCLAGYSLGAVIAFEMAKQLKALGKEIKLLAMIDGLSRDPELIKTHYDLKAIIRVIGLNIYLLKYGPARAFNYTAGVVKAGIKKIFGRFFKKPAEVLPEPNSVDEDFDVFWLHVSAYQKYEITPYDGNIVVFRASEVTTYMDDYKYLGWKPFSKKIKSITIKGRHFTIFDNSNIREFGNKLQKVLDEGF